MTRKNFLLFIFSIPVLLGFKPKEAAVIRPPAALDEEAFKDRCVRCGNCMKVCPTNGLQPTMLETGLAGLWTPRLVPEVGYCEYNCTLCGHTCPTGAIRRVSLEEKHAAKMGTAQIDRSLCIAWAENRECIVCEEHCPVHNKAIRFIEEKHGEKSVKKPYVVNDLCVGCGICQNKCPVRPVRAVKISP